MEREEIEQVEKELDEILKIVQPVRREENGHEPEDVQALTEEEENLDIQEEECREEESREEKSGEENSFPEEQKGRLRILKASDGMVAAFFVPIAVMIIIFAQRGIFPFGEECFLRTDMYHQYAPFFSEFQHKLTNGGSLLYSWDIGMGVNFSALYAYYLASPVNWLLFLCPDGLIIE